MNTNATRRVRIAAEPHDGCPFKSVIVNGSPVGRVKKTEIMGFELWVWTPSTSRHLPPHAATIAASLPAGHQFASMADIRRHFAAA